MLAAQDSRKVPWACQHGNKPERSEPLKGCASLLTWMLHCVPLCRAETVGVRRKAAETEVLKAQSSLFEPVQSRSAVFPLQKDRCPL